MARRSRMYMLGAVFAAIQLWLPARVPAGTAALESRSQPMLHTFVEIKAWGSGARAAIDAALDEMDRVNDLLNNYDPESEISSINSSAGRGWTAVSPETLEVLQQAVHFGDISGGAFDFTIGPLIKLWGFARDNPGLEAGEPDPDDLKAARNLVKYSDLQIRRQSGGSGRPGSVRLPRRGMWIDVGAFSKGYVADRAVRVLRSRGIANALVVAGGTVCAFGVKPDDSAWRIGIRHPRREGSFLTIITLKDQTVSTSGDYEKYYKKNGRRRTHIIDPRTGTPVETMQAVTVIAPEGVTSDALSTALFVLGPGDGMALVERLNGVEALLVTQEGNVLFSSGWPQKQVVY